MKKTKDGSKQERYRDMCWECGMKLYRNVHELNGITVCLGTCPECGKEGGIVPASDWQYREGNIDIMNWD
jgi:hypothetical protein